MKTTLGATIRRVSRTRLKGRVPLCYSCNIPTCGGIQGKKYWVNKGNCDGFLHGLADDKFVIKCTGYKEQTFAIPRKLKEQLRDWVSEYAYQTLEGKHNITQQSDNWFAMELEIFAGLLATLQNRHALNDLMLQGQRLLKVTKGKFYNEVQEELMKEVKP